MNIHRTRTKDERNEGSRMHTCMKKKQVRDEKRLCYNRENGSCRDKSVSLIKKIHMCNVRKKKNSFDEWARLSVFV